MSKTKVTPLFGTSNIIHSGVWRVQSLHQKSTETKCPPHINCTNNKREVNKRKHIVLSLLIAVATILMVSCPPDPMKDKGGTPLTLNKLVGMLKSAIDMQTNTQEDKKTKQNKILNLMEKIKAFDKNGKVIPTTKDELVLYIKAEIWSQGKDGKQLWGANLNNIDTALITDMSYLFSDDADQDKGKTHSYKLHPFNGDIGNWDVSSVTNTKYMFKGAVAFNQDIGNWDVSSATNMVAMFFGATSFNQDISNWDVSSATNIAAMFLNATSFNQDISNWDVSSATNMVAMFFGATSFNRNLDDWDEHLKNADDTTYRKIIKILMFYDSGREGNLPIWLAEISK